MEGTITLDDKPLPDIRVQFQPQATGDESPLVGSYGLTDAQGKFTLKLSDSNLEGALIGKHVVTLSDKKSEDPQDSDAGVAKVPKSRIPAKHLKEQLTYEVKSGTKNDAVFPLTSK
ncbi:MAG: hypothetical protein ABL921_09455 [Pirellula sp.]